MITLETRPVILSAAKNLLCGKTRILRGAQNDRIAGSELAQFIREYLA